MRNLKTLFLPVLILCFVSVSAFAQSDPTRTLVSLNASSPAYSTSALYHVGQTVTFSGSTYISLVNCTSVPCASPTTTPSNWLAVGSSSGGGSSAATNTREISAAVCYGGVAAGGGLWVYDNNAPTTVCLNPSASTAGALQFAAAPTNTQYAESTAAIPAYWTGTNLTIAFTSAATSGNVTWEVQTACPAANGSTPGTPTWGTAQTVTTTVPSTAGQQATATLSAIAANGVNGCPATGTTTPSTLLFRIFRSASDSASGVANLVSIDLSTSRSQ